MYYNYFIKSHNRGVAQPGSASGLGPEGRRFKSCRPDQNSLLLSTFFFPKSTIWRANGESMKLLLFMISYLLCQNMVRR